MLGERNNKGRIAKNESYSIEEFMSTFIVTRNSEQTKDKVKPTLFDKIFRFDKLLKEQADYSYDDGYTRGYDRAIYDVKSKINNLIDQDSFGKKKKK